MGKKWVPLESNPEILSDLADKLGVSADAAVFSDVFGLDEEMLAMIPQPVQAVIMCYPITDSTEAAAKQGMKGPFLAPELRVCGDRSIRPVKDNGPQKPNEEDTQLIDMQRMSSKHHRAPQWIHSCCT